ncbi:hypothetical protein OQA88_728 [Cercophora sp. LCS_1]
MLLTRLTVALTTAFLPGVLAHAGGHSDAEIHAELHLRDLVTTHSKRALSQCANSPAARSLQEQALSRRLATARSLREKRSLSTTHIQKTTKRDAASLSKWSSVSHESTSSFSLTTPVTDLFASNTTCVLVPETVIGPYYVSGELIRTDITSSQRGVPVHLDIQFLDLATCTGIPSLLIDIWHANSSGIYSGVSATGQGGLDSTHGRGVQETDADGVVQFDTLFPGHYTGRATHVHVMATADATVLPNETFTGGTARHIGQMYFDDALREEVEALEPYSLNSQDVTTNAEDMLAPDEATEEYDPFLKWVMLGDSLEDGLLMWITIGLDQAADYSENVAAAAHYLEGGGVDVEGGGMSGGPGGSGGPPQGSGPEGGPFGNGTAPPVTGNGTASSSNVTVAGTGSPTPNLTSTSLLTSATANAAARRRGIGWN